MLKLNQNKFLFLILVLSFIGFSQSAFALSPPWYVLQALLKSSLEADQCVKVGKLTGEGRNMEVLINVCEYNKAQALSTLLSKEHIFNDKLMVTVRVVFANQIMLPGLRPNNANEMIQQINSAFNGNQYFVQAAANANARIGMVEFKPAIVQYFADDISDWYRNTNLVAAEAFKRILDVNALRSAGIQLYVTTSRVKETS